MPATLSAPQVASLAGVVENLANTERAVALYASDMPNGYRLQGREDANLADWMVQGVARLGREEIRRRASFLRGHRKLWLDDMTTPEIDRRHKKRFPSKRRLDLAESMASTSLFWISVAPSVPDVPIVIDGPCPQCDGAGKVWANIVINEYSGEFEERIVRCWVCRSGGGVA
jgi:hypothetical protein